ncbi:nucleotidyltransferase family protein [Pedobacter sp. BS3]|uniref:nucleotidyltransferase family protein n=1 Tax=Pedobacter sp. BS3 TaxID=2567937 RepID=UPI00397C5419
MQRFYKFECNYTLMDRFRRYIADIEKLCKQYKVKSLYAFGSVLTNNYNNQSDIDLIVDFSNVAVEDYADNYFDFKFSLEDMFQRPVDLLEEKAIKNPYFKQAVNQQKQLVYGQ